METVVCAVAREDMLQLNTIQVAVLIFKVVQGRRFPSYLIGRMPLPITD